MNNRIVVALMLGMASVVASHAVDADVPASTSSVVRITDYRQPGSPTYTINKKQFERDAVASVKHWDSKRATFMRILRGRSGISSEMALRLSKTLGRSPESWLAMQGNYNLWQAKRTVNLDAVEKIAFEVA